MALFKSIPHSVSSSFFKNVAIANHDIQSSIWETALIFKMPNNDACI